MSLTISRLTIFLLLFISLLLYPNTTRAQQFLNPPTIPLAVRSPYLNCWLQYNKTFTTSFGHTWPTTSSHSQTLGWTVLVRVDSLTYLFLGDVDPNLINGTVNSTNIMVGPTSSILCGQAGPMQVNLTFLNPIEPQDWVKQSIPFSYMSFTAKSSDGASHHVQVYSDVSGEWVSGNRTQKILWNTTSDSSAIFHNVTLQTSAIYTEIFDQAEWGTLYFATPNGTNVSYQSGLDADCRGNFTRNGVLNLQQDQNRSISDGSTVFALAYELYNITATQVPAVWAIGYTTDFAINYSTDLSGAPTPRIPYYKTQYSDDKAMASTYINSWGENMSNFKEQMVDFLNDFSNASSRAQKLEEKIFQDSESVAPYLSSLTSLALAEVYGSMQLTIWADGHGSVNKSDVLMFMKNIGGVEKNRVNAVETIYAAFPALMYIDPSLGAPLLEPLFRLQASFNYEIEYFTAPADLGSNYPSVSGGSNHGQSIEQTGNMLIMTYAYARASGDGSLISRYYKWLSDDASNLIKSMPFTRGQSSADNLTADDQTNLAIKAIIAIEAMSKMSSVFNQTDDMNRFSSAAAGLYAQWKSLALGSDQHLLTVYRQNDSWTLGYNLFADVWLGTNLVEPLVYNGHSSFINNLVLNSNFSSYGMPVDNTNINAAVSSWSLFVAAMTTNQGLRSALISKVFNGTITSKATNPAFAAYYDTSNGTSLQGIVASPALGAMYAPLALKVPAQAIYADGPVNTNSPYYGVPPWNIGAIIGGVFGGVTGVLAVIGITAFVWRRRKRAAQARRRSVLTFSTDFRETGPAPTVTPFDPYSDEAAQYSRILAEQQPLVTEGPDAEMVVALHGPSSTPRMRRSPPQPEMPVPVGLSHKEIARLRAEGSWQSRSLGVSSSDVLQSTSSPDAVPKSREMPPDSRRLNSEVEYLVRREIERLRAEGLVVSVPPSYAEGNGSFSGS